MVRLWGRNTRKAIEKNPKENKMTCFCSVVLSNNKPDSLLLSLLRIIIKHGWKSFKSRQTVGALLNTYLRILFVCLFITLFFNLAVADKARFQIV